MVSRTIIVVRNVAANWAGFAVNALITFALTPYVLAQLGTTRYGIWILTSSVIGYYGMLDLGFRAGVTQHLTRYLARRDYRSAGETLSSAVAAFLVFGAFLAALSLLTAYFAPIWFDIPPVARRETFWCVLVVGLGAAFQYALCPYASILSAAQRFDLASYIGVATRILNAIGIVLALRRGYGLVGVSVVTAAATALDYVLRWYASVRVVPELRASRENVHIARLREVFSFGIWNFLIAVNRYIYQHVPNLLIAAFLPISAVGHYALATGLLLQIGNALTPVSQVLYPAAAAMHAQSDGAGLRRLYLDGSRMMMLVMIPVVLIAGFYAEAFYTLWVGTEYVSGTPYPSVAFLLQILLVSTATMLISNVGAQILVGANFVRLIAVTLICGSALSLSIASTLVYPLGLVGVALGTVIASVVVDGLVIPWLVQKRMRLPILEFVRSACARPALVCALDLAILAGFSMAGRPSTWVQLGLHGAASAAACAAVTYVVGITPGERERFLLHPLRRVIYKHG